MSSASIPAMNATAPKRSRLFFLYHEIRSGSSDYSYVIQAEQFQQHLDLFASLRSAGDGKLQPEVTFDDGHVSNHDIAAPLLASHGITATCFITVGWTGTRSGYMGWNELRALHAAGHTIGAHGWSHTLLTHLNDADLQRELSQSRMTLEDKLGTQITAMSLPGGRQNARVLATCKAAGYTHIFTSVPRPEPAPLAAVVGRMNVLAEMRPEWLAQVLDPVTGILASMQRKQRIKDAAKSLLGDRLYERLWSVVNRREQEDPAA